MAKVLASRAHSDEALQELLERAAARFSSIHDRWSAVTGARSLPVTTEPSLAASSSAAAGGAASKLPEHGDLTLPLSESGVCVTPILGIATSAEDEPRPRFKTLMGVPRNDPDADERAGSATPPEPQHERSSDDGDAARLKRPTPPPLPERFLALPEAAQSPSRDPRRAAVAAQPTHQTLPPLAARAALPQRSALAPSSPDIAAELAALRRSQRRRSWLVGVGAFAATLAVFAIAAPRERALAVRWLRDEYRSRLQPSPYTVADTARALQPSVVEPVSEGAGVTPKVEMPGAAAEMRRIEGTPSPTMTDSRPDPAIDGPPATTAPVTEVASKPRSQTTPASGLLVSDQMQPGAPHGAAVPAETLADGSAPLPPRAAATKATAVVQTHSRVAAPRQRSTRRAAGARATTADVKARAPRSTKERSTRQNSPRRGINGGIIRETPF